MKKLFALLLCLFPVFACAATETDGFAGTNATLLTSHATDQGHSWINYPPAYTGNAQLNGSGSVVTTNSNEDRLYVNVTPLSADYSVFATVQSTGYSAGVIGRQSSSADTCYVANYLGGGANEWRITKYVAGVATNIGSYPGDAPTTSRNIELRMTGSLIELYIGGVQRISVTDTSISAAGFPGIDIGDTGTIGSWSATNMTGGGGSTAVPVFLHHYQQMKKQ